MVIDTNVLVRYFVQDHEEQAQQALALFNSSKRLMLPDVVVAETYWVMRTTYSIEIAAIVDALNALIKHKHIFCNNKLLELTLHYLQHNKSFIDAYIAAFAVIHDDGIIVSFDKGIGKFEGITRMEP